jgi:hypothetical protein
MSTSWRRFGASDVRQIVDARLILHHAVQLAAAPGRSLLEARADDSQTALEWSPELQALVGERIAGQEPWCAALRPVDLTLLVLTPEDEGASALLLSGRSLDEAFAWLQERAAERGAESSRLSPEPPYEMPGHAVANGAPFPAPPPPELAELARHLANSDRLFRGFAGDRRDATPVRCWPHHFDIGAVIRLDPAAGDESPTVGFGMSPGDEGTAEPYFYVNAWPRPGTLPSPLPQLPADARWETESWFGAVLLSRALVGIHEAEGQEAGARDFLVEAVRAVTGLLGGR